MKVKSKLIASLLMVGIAFGAGVVPETPTAWAVEKTAEGNKMEAKEHKNPFGLVYRGAIEKNEAGRVQIRPVEYKVNGIKVAANLYLPAGYDEKDGKTYAAVTVAHPNGGCKEQVAGLYAQKLAELGYIEKGAFKGRAIVPVDREAAKAAEPQPRPQEEKAVVLPAAEPAQVPIVGNVAAGSPILAQECIEDYLTFDTGGREGEYFALRVRGESMLGLGILPGDLVVVHQQQTARNGEIVVALLEDEATVKTFSRKGGKIWLLPANPDYQPIDGTDCTIMGKVVAVVRQY